MDPMARPAAQRQARRAEIIQAALDCFARYGYEGTTNRRIASAAGLKSPSLIYHYFPSKASLFQACLKRVGVLDNLRQALESGHDQEPEVYLSRVAAAYLTILHEERIKRLVLMILSAAQSRAELLPIVFSQLVPSILLPLQAYLQRQVALGNLRPVSPVVAAQQFLGPLFLRALTSALVSAELPFAMPNDEEFVASLVHIFLEGLRAPLCAAEPGLPESSQDEVMNP
jgi:TetR/AcrR family transcriptional repressor of mexJK operon